ncbi:aminopeptidase P family N-terminal domain-containing protein, partial [Craterilacuibacter sp.]|uniref:aminopeptidase P family N-terminal domain-containing protein n=1 Tax=Craterilacuibacter sp. TaxID=2870909 RepID=UPI003F36061B
MKNAITALRQFMQQHGLSACLIPSSDPHLSEYLPGHWQARQWLSGFTGSMGTLIVTQDFAGVWADSRYWEQAEKELAGSGITLVKVETAASVQHLDWLAATLTAGQTLAVDGDVLGQGAARALQQALAARGITLKTDLDPVAAIWAERPALPGAPVYEHLAPQASETRADKLARVRAAMHRHGCSHHWLSTLDDIAWLLNLRGSDVSYNPVFLAHLLLDKEHATLFVGAGKIDAALATRLATDGITLAPYPEAKAVLAALTAG